MIRRALIRCSRCSGAKAIRTNSRAEALVFLQSKLSLRPPPSITATLSCTFSTFPEQQYEPFHVTSFKDYTTRILEDTAIGEMQEADWNEAHTIFLWWTQQATPEAVETAWRLLDRLVQEQRASNTVYIKLETHWLNRLLETSRIVTANDKQGGVELVVGPMEWLSRLDQYAPYLLPNAATYSMIIRSLTKWNEEPDPEFVESLLYRMYEEAEDNPEVLPDVATYNSVLYMWSNSGLDEAPQRSEALFEHMEQHGLEPDAISYGTLITTWSRSREANAAIRAQEVLREMEQRVGFTNNAAYNAALAAWERSSHKQSVQRCDALFREMMQLYEDGNDDVKPDGTSFRIVIRKCAVNGQNVARADVIIRQMQQMYADGELDTEPPRKLLELILHQWANSASPNASERAESLLRFMHDLYAKGNDKMKPTLRNFSPVIAAWTKSTNYNAASHAEDVLNWMLKGFEGDEKMIPNRTMCSSIISAWSKSRDPDAPKRAQALLDQMHEWYECGNESVKPNIITYNALIKVWVKSRHPEGTERIESIMRHMGDVGIHPDRVSYNQLMNAYANRSGDDPSAPERAESVLRHLAQRYEAGEKHMKPDLISFSIIMKAWSNSPVEGAAERAEEFLRYMQDVYESTGDEGIRPNAVCFATAIQAWIKNASSGSSSSPDAAIRAANLLEEVHDLQRAGVKDMKLQKQIYFDILQLLAKSRSANAGQVAERLLLHLQSLAEQGHTHMSPSTKFFNLTIRAWSISGHAMAAQRAESILNLMLELNQKGIRPDLQPNRLTYNFVIKAWSKSGDIFGGKRAEQHLHRMRELSEAGHDEFTPDAYTYGDLAVAWRNSGHVNAKNKANKYAELSKRLNKQVKASSSSNEHNGVGGD